MEQTGVMGKPEQSVSTAQGPHVFVAWLQTGLKKPQSVLALHSTHTSLVVWQRGFAAGQWVVSAVVHSTQTPLSCVIGPALQAWVSMAPLHASAPVQRQGMSPVLLNSHSWM
jgi:hypothetical protein